VTPQERARAIVDAAEAECVAKGWVYCFGTGNAKETLDKHISEALAAASASGGGDGWMPPKGWALVPIAADDNMRKAGIDVSPTWLFDGLRFGATLLDRHRASLDTNEVAVIFAAMASAAPPPPTVSSRHSEEGGR